jgi:perosamine synthetase
MFEPILDCIRQRFSTTGPIVLHEPCFKGEEKAYALECIDSTFVSSVGQYVDEFERRVADFVGSHYAVAVVNGTQALFVALRLIGARPQSEVITQSLSFVATANAIVNTGAQPVFVDVDLDTLGMSPRALAEFLKGNAERRGGQTVNIMTGLPIVGCVPMHTLGHPCRIDEIREVCDHYDIAVVEDAAESLGSYYKSQHTGTFGHLGIFSFNGNKIVTTGGGGMLVTDDQQLAQRAKHLTTTAKRPHRWEFVHDESGYNFRLPNLNAALGVAQMEQLDKFVANKRQLAEEYRAGFSGLGVPFFTEPSDAKSNYWLNALLLDDEKERDQFLRFSNDRQIMTRPLWRPMHKLDMYQDCQRGPLPHTEHLYARLVNIPSSVRL